MAGNPYFDDGPEDSSGDDFDFDEAPQSSPSPSAPPETAGSAGLPAWAQISSDLADEAPVGFEPVAPQLPPVPQRVSRPAATVPAPPVITVPSVSRPQPAVPEPVPVPMAPVPVPQLPQPVPQERVEIREPAPTPTPPMPVEAPVEPAASPASYSVPSRTYDDSVPVPTPSRQRRRLPAPVEYDEDDYLDEDEDEMEEVPPSRRRNTRDVSPARKGKVDFPEDEEEEEDEPKKKGFFSRPPKQEKKSKAAKASPSGMKPPGRFAGGRGLALALKALIWFVLGVVVLTGLKQIIAPSRITADQVAVQVQEKLGLNDFPVLVGNGVALEFVRAYLTYGEGENQSARVTKLTQFMPLTLQGPESDGAGWMELKGATGQAQNVVSGPFLVNAPVIDGAQATYFVAAQVEDPTALAAGAIDNPSRKWVYLSVPLVKDEFNNVAIGGSPGFVPGILRAEQGFPLEIVNDESASDLFGNELPGFLTAWAASDATELRRYVTEEAQPLVGAGLGGAVLYSSYSDLVVETLAEGVPTTSSRQASVSVTWNVNGLEITQQYRMVVSQAVDGLWYVEEFEGGGFTAP